jgi:1-deoxy-D-xylulose-5-phosphate reductoisomerase
MTSDPSRSARSTGSARGVVVLGATGSVGAAAADVLEEQAARFRVVGLAAARQGDRLLALGRRLGARVLALVDEEACDLLRRTLRPGDPEVRSGRAGVLSLLGERDVDVVVQGTSGAAGLEASLETVRRGKRLALANKESMVVAGPLLRAEASRTGAEIVPVDSEHCALHQCLRAGRPEEVRRLILTASGGPFRGRRTADLGRVTPAEALRHPTWDMGPRITVDSATLMNKALEVIEARWLFDVEPSRIDVVVHPQSIVHSLVEFVDGSVVAQMGPPDMRGPIRYALGWPERLAVDVPRFDWRDYARLTFEAPDRETFGALDLGYEAAGRGGTSGAALNAADEVAVERFLAGDLPFLGIAPVVADALRNHPFSPVPTLDDLLRVDAWGRRLPLVTYDRKAASVQGIERPGDEARTA